ncbi:MAG: DUF1934 domain-containing protein [Clostridia bacterium]|nr:DUF1934 domain-containing protein [Clostridia bacterium]
MEQETKVRLKIVSRMREPGGDVNEIRHARRGTLTRTAQGVQILYDEEQDGEKARILLSAEGRAARMLRRGMTSAELRFIPGEKTSSAYVTMYGDIPVMIDTRAVSVLEDERGGVLALDYDCYVSGEMTYSTRFELTWRV